MTPEEQQRHDQELIRLLTEERDQWMGRARDLEKRVANQRAELRKLNCSRKDVTLVCDEQRHNLLMSLSSWVSLRVIAYGPEGRSALTYVLDEIDRRLVGPHRPGHNRPHEARGEGGGAAAAGSSDWSGVRGAEGDVAPCGP